MESLLKDSRALILYVCLLFSCNEVKKENIQPSSGYNLVEYSKDSTDMYKQVFNTTSKQYQKGFYLITRSWGEYLNEKFIFDSSGNFLIDSSMFLTIRETNDSLVFKFNYWDSNCTYGLHLENHKEVDSLFYYEESTLSSISISKEKTRNYKNGTMSCYFTSLSDDEEKNGFVIFFNLDSSNYSNSIQRRRNQADKMIW